MQLIENNVNSFYGAHPTHVSCLVDTPFICPKRFWYLILLRELHFVSNSSAKKRMIQHTTCYGEQKDKRAKSH